MTAGHGDVVVLAGGVGAARFLRGLVLAIEPERVTAVVNTGDDTELHGLSISPDLDTIVYTLAGAIDPERGWGLAGETWNALEALERYAAVKPAGSRAATTWFGLGDRDLATHLYRTARLAEGATSTEVAGEIGRAWKLAIRLLPMTDGRFRTMIRLARGGDLVPFQDYFVRLRHGVAISSVEFEQRDCVLNPEVRDALTAAEVVVVAPSNPLVSIGPIRALDGVDEALASRRASVVAVSPIVGGQALKGPADRMLSELGMEPTVVGVAGVYAPIAATLVIDPVDAALADAVEAAGMRCVVTPTVMTDAGVARALAETCLAAARRDA
jgi:LPPG:FO 2-phospho-L-lactate transferase